MQRNYWASGPINFVFISLIYLLILRFEYLYWNWPIFSQTSPLSIAEGFLVGLRFDLAVTAWFTGPFWLYYFFFPLSWARNVFKLTVIYLALQLPFLILNSTDMVLLQYTWKRTTVGMFYLGRELAGRATGILAPYAGMIFLQTFLIVGGYYLILVLAKRRPVFPYPLNWPKHISLSFMALAALITASRGGLQKKPINFTDAQVFLEGRLNNLSLNSHYSVLKTIGKAEVPKYQFFEKTADYIPYLNWKPEVPRAEWAKNIKFDKKPNVIFLIVESLALEYLSTGPGDETYMPFIQSLTEKSLFFDNAFANGRRSIEGIGALYAGVPALMDEPFISSEFSANSYKGFGTLMAQLGYDTSFFHGVGNGTMYFDSFMRTAGVPNYYGLNEYPLKNKSDFDGTWGIFDEPYLHYFGNELLKRPEPFFTGIFTLSSHQPFTLPNEYKGKYKKGAVQIIESIQYVDEALKKFFTEYDNAPWMQNTLFIITGDHTAQSFKQNYQKGGGHYRVPIMFYMKNAPWKPQRIHDIAQHIDIMPTVLDMLTGEPAPGVKLSQSLLRPHPQKHFTAYFEGRYAFINKDYLGVGTEPDNLEVFKLPVTDSQRIKVDDKIRADVIRQTEADMQYFSEAMWQQKLYWDETK